ncbi:MAG: transposase [Methylotenera sp.]|nr:transposase [Methylotenera sp.]MDP2103196.1 transposase [Methylotenera sp.]MDP2281393.1 transposase [Methylotenera sp.]MDP3059534.1 transposase [Methylotenera sp.]MDP3095481.1 transposase [Methylotenera sp.]
MTDFLPVILNRPLDRQRYSREFKRLIVEASLIPGTSIAAVALSHGINANLLHKWRWSYRHGEFGAVSAPSTIVQNQAKLLAAPTSQPTPPNPAATLTSNAGYIELFFNDTRIMVHGAPDSQTLRSVIDALRL